MNPQRRATALADAVLLDKRPLLGDAGTSGGASNGGGGVAQRCVSYAALLVTVLNPLAALGCGAVCLPAATGALASITGFLGMSSDGADDVVAYGTLGLFYLATVSLGHSARVRKEWDQYVLGLLSLLLIVAGKAIVRSGAVSVAGQLALCSASVWNSAILRRATDGGKNCLRLPKRYNVKSLGWKLPQWGVLALVCAASSGPFAVLLFFPLGPV